MTNPELELRVEEMSRELKELTRATERVIEALVFRTTTGENIKYARTILKQWKAEAFPYEEDQKLHGAG